MDDRETQARSGLGLMDIPCAPDQLSALLRHLALVDQANARFNLTTIHPEDAVALHLLDSLAATSWLNRAPAGGFADLGSGAGFPGIPLAVLTGREVTLVESVKKKAAFLEGAAADLRLKSTVRPVRAEELALERRGAFSAVTARALSALPSLVELAAPLLVVGGLLICLKGRPEQEEIERGDTVAAMCGMERIALESASIPGVDAARTLVVYRREGQSRTKLPRRNGMAQRQPLA